MKKAHFKRGLSVVMTGAMLLSAGVPAVSPVLSVYAEEAASAALTKGSVTITSDDEAFAATDFEVIESWFADDNLPEWTNDWGVSSYLSHVQGDHGFVADIALKDSAGADYLYNGSLNVTYKLPDSWDLSHGVTYCYEYDTLDFGAYQPVARVDNNITIDEEARIITFKLAYNNTTDDENKINATKVIIMENSTAADLAQLGDGVYNVGLSMFQNVSSRSLSMAANTMYRKAKVIVKDGRVYLNLTFNAGIVMYQPAFVNKIYSANGGSTSAPTYGVNIPGIVTEYYDDDFVKEFAFNTYKSGPYGGVLNYTDEQLQEMVDTQMLQNGTKYIKNVTLDVTDCIQADKTLKLGFCSDVMDSLYGGDFGSDNGYNTTNVMISAPVKTDETDADVLPAERNLDLSKLEAVFEKYINTSDTNASGRQNYSTDSFNNIFIPAWSAVYQAYTNANATQEQVDNAVALGNESFEKLEAATIGNTNKQSEMTSLNRVITRVESTSADAYTEDSYNALMKLLPAAKAVSEQGDDALLSDVREQTNILNNAYNALVAHIKVSGRSVELSDYIGLNYYLEFTDEMAARKPSITFSYGEGDELIEQTIDFADVEYVEGKGYKYTVKLNAKNMRDTISGKVYVDGEEATLTSATLFNSTVYLYASTVINNAATYGEEAVAAAKALLNYGAASQTLFDYKATNLANSSLKADEKDVSAVTAESLAQYKATKTGSDENVKFLGYNLYLDSLTSMRFYYKGNAEVSCNAENYTTGKDSKGNYVAITGITPANLLNGYDVTIGGMTVHASPASYAYTALTKSSDENLQNAMKAMILYSQAVSAYDASAND